MALSIDWNTKIITVPRTDMTLVSASPEIRELDLNIFRLELKDIEDDEGMPFDTTHEHIAPKTFSGITLARVVELINGYTVTFEDGLYTVNATGANSNIADSTNKNSVSLNTFNSAGLVGLDALTELTSDIRRIIANRLVDNGDETATIYEDDAVTPLYTIDPFTKDERGAI